MTTGCGGGVDRIWWCDITHAHHTHRRRTANAYYHGQSCWCSDGTVYSWRCWPVMMAAVAVAAASTIAGGIADFGRTRARQVPPPRRWTPRCVARTRAPGGHSLALPPAPARPVRARSSRPRYNTRVAHSGRRNHPSLTAITTTDEAAESSSPPPSSSSSPALTCTQCWRRAFLYTTTNATVTACRAPSFYFCIYVRMYCFFSSSKGAVRAVSRKRSRVNIYI